MNKYFIEKLGERMRFGVVFPAYGPYCDRKFAERMAVEAEERGINGIFIWDHYMLPDGNRTLDAYVLLSYLAAKTERIRLGTCVTPLPFRNPAMLAKIIATLDVLSEGRTIVGVGAGWHRPEFEAYSEWSDASVRVRKTREALELMTQLWTKEEVDFKGEFYSAKGAVLEPKPIQTPHPPLWFGTTGKMMLKLAARYGSGWITPVGTSLEEYERYSKTLRNQLPDEKKKNFVFGFVDWPVEERELSKRIEACERAGCNYYCTILRREKDEALKQLRQIERMRAA
jgi:probable F420-dependent oxidoreductase